MPVRDTKRMIDDTVALGLRNKEVIELARRHCLNIGIGTKPTVSDRHCLLAEETPPPLTKPGSEPGGQQ